MKKQPKTNKNSRDDLWDDRPRHKVKAERQNRDAKQIERALKRKDFKSLAEEFC